MLLPSAIALLLGCAPTPRGVAEKPPVVVILVGALARAAPAEIDAATAEELRRLGYVK